MTQLSAHDLERRRLDARMDGWIDACIDGWMRVTAASNTLDQAQRSARALWAVENGCESAAADDLSVGVKRQTRQIKSSAHAQCDPRCVF
ncbi:hypothetical protein MHYP_G00231140 [Metynnis hypsauchen]